MRVVVHFAVYEFKTICYFSLLRWCASGIFLLPYLFQVNGCTGKMGKAVIKAADSAGLNLVPISFGSAEECGKTVQVNGKDFLVHGPTDRENVLASIYDEHPNLIVIDYTVPSTVNGNYFGTYYLKKRA